MPKELGKDIDKWVAAGRVANKHFLKERGMELKPIIESLQVSGRGGFLPSRSEGSR